MKAKRSTTENASFSWSRDSLVFLSGISLGFMVSSLFGILLNETVLESSSNGVKGIHATMQPSNLRERSVPISAENGWKEIHVFYGEKSQIEDLTTLPTDYFRANQWFSQYRQDEVVSKLLHGKRNGYFVDLASNDAVRISNTYALETNFNWRGICMEPNQVYWGGLAYRKCDVVAAVVGDKKMQEIEFNFPKDKAPKGGIVGIQFDNKQGNKGEIQHRYTTTLLEIFQRFQTPKVIDYISLDVEGAEDFVMGNFPFSEYRFNILTVERPSEKLTSILESHGYKLLKTLHAKTETLWVHTSIERDLNMQALAINTEKYKYRQNGGNARIAPEEQEIMTSEKR